MQSKTTGSRSTIDVCAPAAATGVHNGSVLLFGFGERQDGTNATAGRYVGERIPHAGRVKPADYFGWNFTKMGAENLIVEVDGTRRNITLDMDLSTDEHVLRILNLAWMLASYTTYLSYTHRSTLSLHTIFVRI